MLTRMKPHCRINYNEQSALNHCIDRTSWSGTKTWFRDFHLPDSLVFTIDARVYVSCWLSVKLGADSSLTAVLFFVRNIAQPCRATVVSHHFLCSQNCHHLSDTGRKSGQVKADLQGKKTKKDLISTQRGGVVYLHTLLDMNIERGH